MNEKIYNIVKNVKIKLANSKLDDLVKLISDLGVINLDQTTKSKITKILSEKNSEFESDIMEKIFKKNKNNIEKFMKDLSIDGYPSLGSNYSLDFIKPYILCFFGRYGEAGWHAHQDGWL